MRNILIVVDQLHRGGIAAHIESEVRSLDAQGVEVHLAAGSIVPGALVPPGLAGLLVGPDLSPLASPAAVCDAARQLAAYLREHEIGLVHAHPFTSCVAGYLAAGLAGTAFIYTLHGPSSLDAPYGPVYEALLKDYVVPGAGWVVCVSPETEALVQHAGAAAVSVIGNPVELVDNTVKPRARGRLALASRLDKARLPGIADFLDKAVGLPIESIDIYGDGDARDEFLQIVEASPVADRVRFLGWSYDLHARWQDYSCAAGMGRVVPEASAVGLPVVLVGVDGVKGLLSSASFAAAARCNFSGRGLPNVDGDTLISQFADLARNSSDVDLRTLIAQHHEEASVWERFRGGAAAIPAVNGRYTALILRRIEQVAGRRGPLYAMNDVLESLRDVPTPGIRERAELLAAQSDLASLSAKLQASEAAVTAHQSARGMAQAALGHAEEQIARLRVERDGEQKARARAEIALGDAEEQIARLRVERDGEQKARARAEIALGDAEEQIARLRVERDGEQEARTRAEIALGDAEEARAVAVQRQQRLRLTCDYLAAEVARVGREGGAARVPISQAGTTPVTRGLNTPVTRGLNGLVSIVLPVYNQASYLPQAIQGVLAQTYDNWELILVNDGSSDDFAGAVTPYLSDPRIRPFTQPNQRLPSALNNGLSRARGEFVTWTSADNVMLPTQLQALVRALVTHPEAGLAYSDYEAIDDRGAPLVDPDWRRQNRPDGSARLRLPSATTVANFHESGDNFLGASFLWRSDVQAVVGNHDEHLFGGEDYDFWLRAHIVTPFVHVADSLYLYRVHDNTLNARAKELNIRANVDRLLACDRQRRTDLLRDPLTLASAENGFWRSASQLRPELDRHWEYVRYSELASGAPGGNRVRVLAIDVPLWKIDPTIVAGADIVLAADDLTYHWLKAQALPWHIRLMAGAFEAVRVPVMHAIGLRLFERDLEARGQVLATKPPAIPLATDRVEHVLVMIQNWARGGMEQVVLDLATGLRRRGARVTLAVADEDLGLALPNLAERHGLEVAGFVGSPDAVLDYVTRERVTIVSYHHCSLGIQTLENTSILSFYTLHNSYVWFNDARRADLRSKLRSMTAVVAVSRQVAAYARRWFEVDPAKLIVIPNGTDLAGVDADTSPAVPRIGPEPGGGFAYLNVATFNRVKMQNVLLAAFARVAERTPDARLTLVGSPADRTFYEEILRAREELGLEDAVTIVPGTDRATVHALMGCHRCLVLPSLVEGWSISLLEAAMLGLPAIVSDVGSARDMAQRSAGVHVIPPVTDELEAMDDAALWRVLNSDVRAFEHSLAAAMLDARERHAEFAIAAQDARERVLREFTTDAMAERYLAAFTAARTPSRLV